MATKASRILITGGNTGVGYEVAKQLLQRGHEVLLACRDSNRAQNAVQRLQQVSGSPKVDTVLCDLSSFESVRACAREVSSRWPALDVLVCNAAVITQKPTLTADGFDTMYQVNHLSHMLLTQLLLPKLLQSDAARIVVVGSALYARVPETLADPMLFHKLHESQLPEKCNNQDMQPQQQQQQQQALDPKPTQMQLYSVTKLYNLWFVRHFAAAVLPQLLASGSSSSSNGSSGSSSSRRLVINAVSPGFVPTSELSRNVGGLFGRFAMKYIISWAPFAVSLKEGGARVAALCDGESEGQTCGSSYSRRSVEDVAGLGADDERAAALWQQSCQDLNITDFVQR